MAETTFGCASSHPSDLQVWTCSCLNVKLHLDLKQSTNDIAHKSEPWVATLNPNNGVVVSFPYLTARESVTLPGSATSIVCTRCLNCDVLVYGAAKPAPLGPARVLGFNTFHTPESPSRDTSLQGGLRLERSSSRPDTRFYEPLVRPSDGQVWILQQALSPQQVLQARQDPRFSQAFQIVVFPKGDYSHVPTESQEQDAKTYTDSIVTTPTRRPSFTSTRKPSSGQLASGITYALPSVPSHLLISPPQSPKPANPSVPSPAPSSSTLSASIPATSFFATASNVHPLAIQLDAVAVDRLKEFRTRAEAEVFELLRLKKREMELLEKNIRQEAQILMDIPKSKPQLFAAANNPSSMMAASVSQPLTASIGININGAIRGRSRDSAFSGPEQAATQDLGTAAAINDSRPGTTDWEIHGQEDHDEDLNLPPSAFERRSTLASSFRNDPTGPGASIMSSSLSALSASFALRGRDPSPQLADWAEKRRLRERYPEGDHSALPSAVNSDEEYNETGGNGMRRIREASANSINTEDEAELESRGRGRRVSTQRLEGFSAPENTTDQNKKASAKQSNQSETGSRLNPFRGRALQFSSTTQLHPPPTMSSSLLAKSPAVVAVDSGKHLSPSHGVTASLEGSSRPRHPPPANTEPLKPATKEKKPTANGASGSTDASGEKTLKNRKSSEKKVAFAETEDTVDTEVLSDEDDDEQDEDQDPLELIDESAVAVFEIDEESEVNGFSDEEVEAAEDEVEVGPDSQETLPKPLRTSEADRNQDQNGNDRLRGLENQIRSSVGGGSFTTDEDEVGSHSSNEIHRGIGAASFSALAASHSAISNLATSLARADHSGFDPASLRLDGRVVPESSLGVNGGDADAFLSGSVLGKSLRGMSTALKPSSLSRGPASETNPVVSINSPAKRAGIRGRVAKEDADTEVRLSGLLAPNAPSHRSLWSPKETKARKSGKSKYQLDEEDDQKWAAWQKKVKDNENDEENAENKKSVVRSNPMNVGPPSMFIAPGIGPRKESTMIDPTFVGSVSSASTARALEIGKRTWGYGSFYDNTSGFEKEPKTSLPYKEKMMVPSLRKAFRKSMLETIPDVGDAEVSPIMTISRPTSVNIGKASPTLADKEAAKGALSSTLVARGFLTSSAEARALKGESADAFSSRSGTTMDVAPKSDKESEKSTQPVSMKDVGVSTHTSGTGTGTNTPTSMGRRSPRPPYVPPPPPTSYSLVLESDPANAPKPLKLFQVDVDASYVENEEGEEAETTEGWLKVLKFLHRLEALKLNKRTGWFHHRVSRPESIADHMYRMGMLALLCPLEKDVDLGKCVMLALVHDLAEAEVGDLTPLDKVTKEEKARREFEAIQYFAHDLLGSSPAGLRIEALWNEYEDRETKESKLVKDLDRFELCLQAIEYEEREGINDLQSFYEGSLPFIQHPRVRQWARVLAKEREKLWRERELEYEQKLDDVDQPATSSTREKSE